jgi:protein-S-isoprenylcysteine O-methyltransferase Ste14
MLMMDIGILFWFGDRGSFLRESGLLVPMTGKVFFGIFGAWLLVVLVALFKRATVEDAVLQEKFSNEWDEWAKRVPYAFIPGAY